MSDNINKMDFKQLRNEVQLLRDELAIMQRKYEDILYNLDNENFSTQIIQEKADMKGDIEINAKSIKTKVSSKEFESTITQVHDKIETAVKTLNKADQELSSRITQTAESIVSEVSKTISVQFISTKHPNTISTSDEQKEMLCNYNNTLYYYNKLQNIWEIYPHDGVNSKFIQTADGFEFTSDVQIDADLIVEGQISADRIDTNNLSCTKLHAKNDGRGYVEMNNQALVFFDAAGNKKIGLEYDIGADEETAYPYLRLGIGSGYSSSSAGCILKLGSGLWIGDTRGILSFVGDYPGNASRVQDVSSYILPTGIFIDFSEGKFYKYNKGVPTEL